MLWVALCRIINVTTGAFVATIAQAYSIKLIIFCHICFLLVTDLSCFVKLLFGLLAARALPIVGKNFKRDTVMLGGIINIAAD